MTTEGHALVAAIEELAANPVLWDKSGEAADAVGFFDWLWFKTYENHQVDHESCRIEEPYDNPEPDLDPADIDDLRADYANLSSRRRAAAEEYTEQMRRFWALRVVSPEERAKHFPKGDWSMADLQAASLGGESFLLPGIGPGQIADAFWALLGELSFRCYGASGLEYSEVDRRRLELRGRLTGGHLVRLSFSSREPIGAAAGLPAHSLCFELDAATPRLHAYPITEAEAAELRGSEQTVWIKDYSGFVRLDQRQMHHRVFGTPRPEVEIATSLEDVETPHF